jgi:hypothetical protein
MAALTRRLPVTQLNPQRDRSLDGYSSSLASRFKQSHGSEHRAAGATLVGALWADAARERGDHDGRPQQSATLKDLQSHPISRGDI